MLLVNQLSPEKVSSNSVKAIELNQRAGFSDSFGFAASEKNGTLTYENFYTYGFHYSQDESTVVMSGVDRQIFNDQSVDKARVYYDWGSDVYSANMQSYAYAPFLVKTDSLERGPITQDVSNVSVPLIGGALLSGFGLLIGGLRKKK